MNESLDELRRAARVFVEAEKKHSGLVTFGAHASVAVAKAELDAAQRALVTAGDVHAARKSEGIVDLIRSGHTHESAKRILDMRGDAKPVGKRREFVPDPSKKNRVFNLTGGKKRKAKR